MNKSEDFSILYCTPENKLVLREYLRSVFFRYSDEYIDYLISNCICDNTNRSSIIVTGNESLIVGCHLFFNTRAKIHGIEYHVRWANNTYLNESCRRYAGLDFVIKINSGKDFFGSGSTKVNSAILKKLKLPQGKGFFTYYFLSFSLILSLAKSMGRFLEYVHFPSTIKVKKNEWYLVEKARDLKVPSDGYWSGGMVDVEFVRDIDFLEQRFFCNTVKKYYVYTTAHSVGFSPYIIVRPIIYKHVPTLLVVDYRYDMAHIESLKEIISFVKKIARIASLGGILWSTSDPNMGRMVSSWTIKKELEFIMAKGFGLNSESTCWITAADNDMDFLRG